jgi:hypothetical protein
MTLNTRVHIAKPIHAEGLFLHILKILEADPDFAPRKATWKEVRKGDQRYDFYGRPMFLSEHIPEERRPWLVEESGFCTTLGQGLAAIWEVEYGSDGPMVWPPVDPEWDRPDEDYGPMHSHFVSANFDTAYGCRLANGARCSDVHAFLLREIKDYLDALGVEEWVWLHEERGTWHSPEEIALRGDADLAAAHFKRSPS